MNKREKIIVMLAIAALLYGGLDYFVLAPGKKKNKNQLQNKAQVSEIITKIDAGLMRLRVLKEQEKDIDYLISRIESGWVKDSFSRPEKIFKSEKDMLSAAAVDFEYSGFIKLGAKILAVIDGMEYAAGEYIKNSNYKISKITSKKVVATTDNDKQVVIFLKES